MKKLIAAALTVAWGDETLPCIKYLFSVPIPIGTENIHWFIGFAVKMQISDCEQFHQNITVQSVCCR